MLSSFRAEMFSRFGSLRRTAARSASAVAVAFVFLTGIVRPAVGNAERPPLRVARR
jgi:hypothetical protein